MQHLLLALALSLVAHDQPRPPARWKPPPVPVMELKEVVVTGRRVYGGCCCGGTIWQRPDDEILEYKHQGTQLTSSVKGK